MARPEPTNRPTEPLGRRKSSADCAAWSTARRAPSVVSIRARTVGGALRQPRHRSSPATFGAGTSARLRLWGKTFSEDRRHLTSTELCPTASASWPCLLLAAE